MGLAPTFCRFSGFGPDLVQNRRFWGFLGILAKTAKNDQKRSKTVSTTLGRPSRHPSVAATPLRAP